jgi:hypothetical protein
MNNGLLAKQFKGLSTRSLLIGLLFLSACGALIFASARYLRNSIQGPVSLSSDTLIAEADPASRSNYFVTLASDENIDTGIYKATTRRGAETDRDHYHVLRVGDKLLLARIDGDTADRDAVTQTGWLQTISSEEQREVIDDIISDYPDTAGLFLPAKLEVETNNNTFYMLLAGIAALGLFGLWMVFRWFSGQGNSVRAIAKDLSRYGQPEQVLSQIESEMTPEHKGPSILTRNWLIRATQFNASARKLEDIVWAHRFTMTHKSYGITTSKQHLVHAYDREGKRIEMPFGTKEALADAFMERLVDAAPWMIAGYSDELEATFKKQRPSFLESVEARKRQHLASMRA